VLNTFDNFAVSGTTANYSGVTFTLNSPLSKGEYENFVKASPDVDNFTVDITEDDLSLDVYGNFLPETNYAIEVAAQLRIAGDNRWVTRSCSISAWRPRLQC